MERGVGIKYQCEFLEPDKLSEWLFDNIGQPNTRTSDGSIIAADHEKGQFFTYNHAAKVLRIALWTTLTDKEAWPKINELAKAISIGCECNLSTWAVDMYEYDPVKKGYGLVYDGLVSGDVERHATKIEKGKEKAVRWN